MGEMTDEYAPGENDDDFWERQMAASKRMTEQRREEYGSRPKPTPFPPVKLPSNQVPRLPDPYLPTPLAPRVTRPEAWVVEIPPVSGYGVVDAMFKIARWCGGNVVADHGKDALGIRVSLFGGRVEAALPGNFIVRQGHGSKVWYEVYETRADLLADWQIMDSAIIPQEAFDASGWSEVVGGE